MTAESEMGKAMLMYSKFYLSRIGLEALSLRFRYSFTLHENEKILLDKLKYSFIDLSQGV